MRADQFHIDRDSHQLTLNGHVHMTLYREQEMNARCLFVSGAFAAAGAGAVAADAGSGRAASMTPMRRSMSRPTNSWPTSMPRPAPIRGNVIVIQGDMQHARQSVRLNVVGKDNKPDKIFANGNVVVDSPTSGTRHRRQRRL